MTSRTLVPCLLAGVLSAALMPAAVSAQAAARPAPPRPAAGASQVPGKETPVLYPGFRPTRNVYGQPDLSGTWSNASLTPVGRPAQYNGRLVMTPAEVAASEGTRADLVRLGNQSIPLNIDLKDVPCYAAQQGSDVQPGGATTTTVYTGANAANCGYDSGFVDPGNTVMRVHGEPRTSFVTYPASGVIPPVRTSAPVLAAQAAGEGETAPAAAGRGAGGGGGAGRGANRGANPEDEALAERCITSFGQSAGPIMGHQLYNNDYSIVQGKDSVAIWVEMVHDVRIVRIGGTHRTDGVRPWYGDSIGHYEGNTLVVETTNYNPQIRLEGRYSTADLVMTERFTRVAKDRLLYQFNVHSPAQWDTDWGGEYEFSASPGIYEYACHEGNYALADIMQGFRDADSKAPAAAAAR